MATDYRVYLLDDFDWGYADISAGEVLGIVEATPSVYAASHSAAGLIIFECRNYPEGTLKELEGKIVYDTCYIQQLPNTTLTQYKPPLPDCVVSQAEYQEVALGMRQKTADFDERLQRTYERVARKKRGIVCFCGRSLEDHEPCPHGCSMNGMKHCHIKGEYD